MTQPPHREHQTEHEQRPQITVAWFLRRELLSIPLFALIVAVLLVFGISPATLLFVFLLAAVTLGVIWSAAPPR